jgi:HSP20 family molecular chaperone IbpA
MKLIEQTSMLRLPRTGAAFPDLSDLYEAIARRAFELFESRGRANGNDLEDWYSAEAELFHSTHLDVTESNESLAMRAEVPGFKANELEVDLEPRRVIIAGKRQSDNHQAVRRIYCDRCSDQVFRRLDLPVAVDPRRAMAVLRDGILELTAPKISETYSIVRAADYQAWRRSFLKIMRPFD